MSAMMGTLFGAMKPRELTDAEKNITDGPLKKRGCTDIICLILFIAAWVIFFIVTFAGITDGGSPGKLYQPRDFRGNYCGSKEQWNNGEDQDNSNKLSFMMNVTAATDVIAKQLLCSTAAQNWFAGSVSGTSGQNTAFTTAQYNAYLCHCCLSPCDSCDGSLSLGGNLASFTDIDTTIASRMTELTSLLSSANLFSPSGANGEFFTNMWGEATKYLVQVCLPDCSYDYASIGTDYREYLYTPAKDDPLKAAWDDLATSGLTSIMASSFKFKAFPTSVCNYDAHLCVPFPGVKFAETVSGSGYCMFEIAAEVSAAVGSALATSWESIGGDTFVSSASETVGMWAGDFVKSLDTFAIVAVLCFVIGMVYLVILRFTVAFCVWFAIFVVLLIFVFGGFAAWIRSDQCEGSGFFEFGHQTAVAIVVAGTSTVVNTVTGSTTSEAYSNSDASDYRGVQTRTVTGELCEYWTGSSASTNAVSMGYTVANYPNAGIEGTSGTAINYCRNPYNTGDTNIARTIWCFSSSSSVVWEICRPIGEITPTCEKGYVVDDETARKALEISAYVIWSLGGIWILLVVCFIQRIRLAIALNEVAATFLAHTPLTLGIPIVQAIIGILWTCLWAISASFLLSQVPDDYTPTEYYETYAEAYGTSDTAGKCNDKWPTGFVWKDQICDPTSSTLKCWRCAPPRYIFDYRFAVSFFVYLWNNAFLIAIGQCCIAGAVAGWFFTPNKEKGSKAVIKTSIWNVFRYHLGSLAFGSFIIAVIQFVKWWMRYLEKQAQAQKNKVMVIVFKVLACCIWCFEKCVQFLNKNAYIQVALRGTNFCTSAKKAFQIIMQNLIRFGTVAILGNIIHCIGYVFIVSATTVLGYFILSAMHEDIAVVIPLLVYICMSYVVGKLFMNVFGLAVDTCLQCVIYVEEQTELGADYVPKPLKRVLDKKPIREVEDETPGEKQESS